VNPVNVVKPTIEGGRKVGEKAVTASGTWKDAKPDWSFVWAWTLDGKLIDRREVVGIHASGTGSVGGRRSRSRRRPAVKRLSPVTRSQWRRARRPPAAPPAPTPTPVPTPAPAPAPVVDAALRKAVTDAAATLENLAYSLRQLAK
jgi:hypothetical protein